MTRFWEIGRNIDFWPKIDQKQPNRIFRVKSENVSVALGSPNFVPNFRKFLLTDSEISNGRTYGRTYGCEFIGSTCYRGEPKNLQKHYIYFLFEQLIWSSEEQLRDKWPKTLFWCKNDHFLPKKGPKRVKILMSEFQIHLFINKQ